MNSFGYRHVVSFEDTNFIGNVYFVRYLSWQGRCRELFLQQYAPGVLEELSQGVALVTLSCSCEYLDQLHPFDEVLVLMKLKGVQQNRITLAFEYWRVAPGERTLVARGDHETACMRVENGTLYPTAIPRSIRDVFEGLSGFGRSDDVPVMSSPDTGGLGYGAR